LQQKAFIGELTAAKSETEAATAAYRESVVLSSLQNHQTFQVRFLFC